MLLFLFLKQCFVYLLFIAYFTVKSLFVQYISLLHTAQYCVAFFWIIQPFLCSDHAPSDRLIYHINKIKKVDSYYLEKMITGETDIVVLAKTEQTR